MFTKQDESLLCSGGEDDYPEPDDLHSPTDSSEDSVEVKVSPVSGRSKRKCAEPRKFRDTDFSGPLKKRMCLQARALELREPPFRPWSAEGVRQLKETINEQQQQQEQCLSVTDVLGVNCVRPTPISFGGVEVTVTKPTRPHTVPPQQPLPLVSKAAEPRCEEGVRVKPFAALHELRVPIHPEVGVSSVAETDRLLLNAAETFPKLSGSKDQSEQQQQQQQRNYKNMTRERRIEANARERTRVHTISAAFETLRRSVPSYSHNQKLSKLSVLRIACAYIMSLSNIVNEEGGASVPSATPTLAECVDSVTRTIQKEGKLRKKKDETD